MHVFLDMLAESKLLIFFTSNDETKETKNNERI